MRCARCPLYDAGTGRWLGCGAVHEMLRLVLVSESMGKGWWPSALRLSSCHGPSSFSVCLLTGVGCGILVGGFSSCGHGLVHSTGVSLMRLLYHLSGGYVSFQTSVEGFALSYECMLYLFN